MDRRKFIKTSMLSTGVVIGLTGGTLALIEGTTQNELTIDLALKKLEALTHQNLITLGPWNTYQIFTHCAQSVEYSMSSFPVHKSPFFKRTLGKLAFSIFSHQGKMSHGLNELIPGAPNFHLNIDAEVALKRLKKALIAFNQYQGATAPHFAYGELSKKKYEMAHVMHLYNHLEEIKS
jgi:hypothetical protein